MSTHSTVPIGLLEQAINRCIALERTDDQVLGLESRQLAEVYGLCIFHGLQAVDLSAFPAHAQTLRKWLA